MRVCDGQPTGSRSVAGVRAESNRHQKKTLPTRQPVMLLLVHVLLHSTADSLSISLSTSPPPPATCARRRLTASDPRLCSSPACNSHPGPKRRKDHRAPPPQTQTLGPELVATTAVALLLQLHLSIPSLHFCIPSLRPFASWTCFCHHFTSPYAIRTDRLVFLRACLHPASSTPRHQGPKIPFFTALVPQASRRPFHFQSRTKRHTSQLLIVSRANAPPFAPCLRRTLAVGLTTPTPRQCPTSWSTYCSILAATRFRCEPCTHSTVCPALNLSPRICHVATLQATAPAAHRLLPGSLPGMAPSLQL